MSFREGTKISLVGLKTPNPFNVVDSCIIATTGDDKISKYKLSDGLYPTIGSLNKVIKKQASGSFSVKLKAHRSNITLKANVKKIVVTGSLAQALGFHEAAAAVDITNIESETLFSEISIKPVILECDFISGERFDQSTRQILAITSTTNNSYTNNIPTEYKDLTRLKLDDITFHIKDFNGKTVDFSGGYTVIRLHFYLNE